MPDQQKPSDEKTVLVIETEVYSRVVGYFRPVSGWNLGKKQEFEDRVPVKVEVANADK
jgi:anaerobic ribonucleoside-triphosphate reductase